MKFVKSINPLLGVLAASGGYPTSPKGLEVVSSKLFKGAEITYKETSICETTEGVNAYSGYVKLPKGLLPDFQDWQDDQAAHLFFWYFEARRDASNAPTSIYLGGGPGATSFDNINGFPCTINTDSNSTTLNKHSWNKHVNMLYIDQPVGTGFSYVSLLNGTFDTLTQTFTPVNDGNVPKTNVTFLKATLDSGALETVPKTTMSSARTMWAFAQVWFNEFPKWQTRNDEISLWTASYGGFYGPSYISHFQDQNALIAAGKPPFENATTLNLATLGLLEPAIDGRAMAKGYARFGYENTYGLQIFNKTTYLGMLQRIQDPKDGCYALTDMCRALVAEGDPERFGNNKTVNAACAFATQACFVDVQGIYAILSDRSPFDVTHSDKTVFPGPYIVNFFNQPWVQEELGVPLNFTAGFNNIALRWFGETGDVMVGSLDSLEKVIKGGVNVAMLYGDRDYRCPWYGGENVSVSLDFPSASTFRSSGYASISTNCSYDGGFVREHGNVSFSRIFQSGHGVAAYQPETVSAIFKRVMFRRDVATGEVDLTKKKNSNYRTKGRKSVDDVKNKVLPAPENTCFVRMRESCTEEQLMALAMGTAVVKDWVVVEPKGKRPVPLTSVNKGGRFARGW
ncbi:hypothetical protein F66182_6711 [Fusarium sp. NRRL 66182]|nr:hypothetical protein F66182_6711 [Fusarium sp. NRRL 66182]